VTVTVFNGTLRATTEDMLVVSSVPVPPSVPAVETLTGPDHSLLAPEKAAAAAASVGSLLRAVAANRTARRDGPTIEDVVRAQMRPVLKEWLEAHLPSVVERLVRAEIERFVGQVLSDQEGDKPSVEG
jgi:hypothetical protein